jgi:hypothetical protein
VADQGENLRFSALHGTMTAWMDLEELCVAVEADTDDCEATGASGRFGLGAGGCWGEVSGSGSESVSMLSHFE